MLPCGVCQKHYRDYVRDHPVPVDDQEQLSRWLVDLHNHMNVITDNSFIQNMEYADVRDVYAYDYEPIGPTTPPIRRRKKDGLLGGRRDRVCLLALVAGGVFSDVHVVSSGSVSDGMNEVQNSLSPTLGRSSRPM